MYKRITKLKVKEITKLYRQAGKVITLYSGWHGEDTVFSELRYKATALRPDFISKSDWNKLIDEERTNLRDDKWEEYTLDNSLI